MRALLVVLLCTGLAGTSYAGSVSLRLKPGPSMTGVRVGGAAVMSKGRLLVVGGDFVGEAVPSLFESVRSDDGRFVAERGPRVPSAVREVAKLDTGDLFFLGERMIQGPMQLVPGMRGARTEWAAAPHPLNYRSWYTVTAVPGGRVLVLGGKDGRPVDAEYGTPTSYLLDGELAHAPHFSDWSLTAPMTHGRALHQASPTRVDGQDAVLVTGGTGFDYRTLAHSELFFPDRNEWEPAGDLLNARSMHSATALPDGRVIVLGGEANGYSLHRVEVFDPTTRQFSEVGNLHTSRSRHTATFLELAGRPFVLVTGGFEMIPGNRGGTLDSVELIDVDRGLVLRPGALARPRHFHFAVAVGKSVLVGGGRLCHGGFHDTEWLTLEVE